MFDSVGWLKTKTKKNPSQKYSLKLPDHYINKKLFHSNFILSFLDTWAQGSENTMLQCTL